MNAPSDYKTCPRCGTRRLVKAVRATDLCGDCKRVEPDWPNVRIPNGPRPVPRFYPDEAERVLKAIVQIAQRCAVIAERRITTCDACGCLVGTWERCPSCALIAAREVAA